MTQNYGSVISGAVMPEAEWLYLDLRLVGQLLSNDSFNPLQDLGLLVGVPVSYRLQRNKSLVNHNYIARSLGSMRAAPTRMTSSDANSNHCKKHPSL